MNIFSIKTNFSILQQELDQVNSEIQNSTTTSSSIMNEQNMEYAGMLAIEKIKSFYTNIIQQVFAEELNFCIRTENAYKIFEIESDEIIKTYEFTKERYEKLGIQNHPKVCELYSSYKAFKDKKEYIFKVLKKAKERLEVLKKEINELIETLNDKIVIYSSISGASVCLELKLIN